MITGSLKKTILPWAVHLFSLFLIPLYFLLHNYFLYREEVDFSSMTYSIGGWFLLPLFIYGLLYIRFKEKLKTARLIALIALIFYFSFGPVYSFLSSIPYVRILTRVSVISGLLSVFILVVIFFHRRINFEKTRFPQFIFILITLLIIFDVVQLFLPDNRLSGNQYDLKEKDPLPAIRSSLKEKPDIYYIFFDELMQSDAVKEYLHHDNSKLDSVLTEKGFFVASKSRSAYYATPFSIASAFQSSVFIEKKKKNIHLLDYLIAYKEIQQNAVVPYLIDQGYSIQNFAHYKLFKEESAAMFKDPSYDTRQIVLNQTFSSLMYQLIYGVMADKLPAFMRHPEEEKAQIALAQKTILKKYDQIRQASLKKSGKPLFVHGHFFVPHLPVYFDSAGRALRYEEVKYYEQNDQMTPAYKMNLAYSGKLIAGLVDEIMKHTNNQAVIIIQSDHGFRGNQKNPVPAQYKFSNFTAVYYPDRNYQSLDKAFFLPNTFRYLLNKYSNDSVRLTSPEYIQLSSDFLDD
jgi:hypothetical protein